MSKASYSTYLDQRHLEAALAQKKYLRDLADAIESGAPLSEIDREHAALALRICADETRLTRPRSRGHQPQFDADTVVARFATMPKQLGISDSTAIVLLAQEHDVSIEAIRDLLKKRKREVASWRRHRILAAK